MAMTQKEKIPVQQNRWLYRRGRQDSFDLGSGVQEIGGGGGLRLDDDPGYDLERDSGKRTKSRSSSRRAKKQQEYYIDDLDY